MIIWVMKIFFVQFFCVFFHLFLISSASVRSIPFLSFIEPIFAWNVKMVSLGISNFLEEISSLSHSVLFLYFFVLITEEGFLILAIIWNSAFRWVYLSFSPLPFASLFSAILYGLFRQPFCLFAFLFLGMVLITASCTCHEPPSTVLQALSIRFNPLNLFVTSTVQS